MDYNKIHNAIIDRAKNRKLSKDIYVEKHHIVPRCMGGGDDKDNIVTLTAREHFIIHWLLHRIYPKNKKLAHAFCMIGNTRVNHITISSRVYEEMRIAQSFAQKGREVPQELRDRISKKNKGLIRSELSKNKISKTRLEIGIKPWNKGRVAPKEEYNSRRGRVKPPISDETRLKMSKARIGKDAWNKGKHGYLTVEQSEKMSASRRGKRHSEEHKKKISNGNKGKLKPTLRKKVAQVDPNTFNIVNIFESRIEACKFINSQITVYFLKSNLKHKCRGFSWIYISELTEEEINNKRVNKR